MSLFLVLLPFWFFNLSVFGKSIPCQLEDEACTTEAFKKIFADIISGVPSLGIISSDPLVLDKNITAELPKLSYSFTDGQISGFKNCSILSAKFTNGGSKFLIKLKCPQLTFTADYEIKGEIFLIKLDGKGACKVISYGSEYTMDINVEIKDDHLKLKDFDFNIDIREKVTYEFKNLFADEKLSEELHKAANENWEAVAKATHGPGARKNLERFMANWNAYFEKLPFQQLFAITS